jgi:hypothetical protein
MPRLTLRTLLAYIDDTLPPAEAQTLGKKVAESEEAQQLIERIKRITRRRGLTTPTPTGEDADVSDPNTVAEYLSDNLKTAQVRELEETCLTSDVHLAEVAACHQILTLVLTEPVRVPPSANQRMYLLADPPACDPSRKPSTTLPVGGVIPPRPDNPEADDPDAALLLGMKRYAASDSWAGRIGLVVAVGVVAASLVLAVLMALPRGSGDRPETAATPSRPTPRIPIGDGIPSPKPKPGTDGTDSKGGKKDEVDPGTGKKDGEKRDKTEPPGPDKVPKVSPPLPGNDVIGELETKEAIVLTRAPEAADWVRIDPAKAAVRASLPILALPGFKADVKLAAVRVHLWGNVPEQIAMPQMVMQSRVEFHPPPPGFDADITVVRGRVYLSALKPEGARVRLRLADEVWDLALPKNTVDVLVQVHSSFTPGARLGDKPRTEVTLAVVAGPAQVQAPLRFKTFDSIETGQHIVWDSYTARLSEKKPTPPELFPPRDPGLPPDFKNALQKVLADATNSLTSPESVRIMLKERLTRPLPDLKGLPGPLQAIAIAFPTQFAVYSVAAIMDGPTEAEVMKDLIDTLGDSTRPYARQATVMALSAWVGQAAGNTERLINGMVAKGWRDDDSELVARLLRGYASFDQGDPKAVDDLVGYLNHPQIAVREAALGNLFAFFDIDAAQVLELRIDVARRNEAGSERAYEKFLNAWKARAVEIKKKMTEKSP